MGTYYNDQLADTYTVDIEKAKELLTEAGYGGRILHDNHCSGQLSEHDFWTRPRSLWSS